MRKLLIISVFVLVVFCILSFGIITTALNTGTNYTEFRATILGPPPSIIGVQVPDFISFGNLSVGEKSDDVKVNITNTGNVDIIVTPTLANSSELIFSYTYFKRITSDPYLNIGDYKHNVSSGSSNYMYARLDLRNYTGTFEDGSVNNVKADIKFVAVQKN